MSSWEKDVFILSLAGAGTPAAPLGTVLLQPETPTATNPSSNRSTGRPGRG